MRKKQSLLVLLPLILILAACSGAKATTAGTTTGQGQSQSGQNGQGQPPDMSKQPIEQKLAIGTLMLEGSDKAITAEQAKTLLPLWKAVKALSSNSNTAQEEINAVYSQIQDAMTADQVQAIKDMSMSMEDTRSLMQKYGVQLPQNPGGSGGQQLSESERATRVAQFQAQRGNQSGGTQNRGRQGGTGGVPGGNFPPGGEFPGGEFPGGAAGGTRSGTPNAQGTPQPNASGRGFRGGFNNIFIDPLIKLLTERAGA